MIRSPRVRASSSVTSGRHCGSTGEVWDNGDSFRLVKRRNLVRELDQIPRS
jgi:hypothetical protein